ncbi:MAG: hypothetical protein M3083_03725 [Actinomycetota bacterium]|nr:hypothetical protein [Actinomycetota bacterium]MDQ6945690.1 hypothetical protein [Actinomycetota bacterium]
MAAGKLWVVICNETLEAPPLVVVVGGADDAPPARGNGPNQATTSTTAAISAGTAARLHCPGGLCDKG